jgi:hypothetical protein
VGSFFRDAASRLSSEFRFIDTADAWRGSAFNRRLNWWLLGHRPAQLVSFSAQVLAAARDFNPDIMLTTGLAPLSAEALNEIKKFTKVLANYSTDDPWNPRQKGNWFLRGLPHYDVIFNTRRLNMSEMLERCARVEYLPFAYEPSIHFPQEPSVEEMEQYSCDLMFAGGADRDRLPVLRDLNRAGLKLHLYGGYWSRISEFRNCAKGLANPEQLRKAAAAAKVCLCLVRRANRDGHAMRSFELPAMRGCMLVEYSEVHREMFGAEGEAVLYFSTPNEMVEKAKRLVEDAALREGLCNAAHVRTTRQQNTYSDRLASIIASCSSVRRNG